MKNKPRILLIASASIILCVALVVACAYALFSDSTTVKNHLKAGTLDVKMERTNLKWAELDNTTGYLTERTNNSVVDFSKPVEENIFGIESGAMVVPGCFYEVTIKLTDNGSVAFDYTVEIVLEGSSNALAQQLKVSVDNMDKGALSAGTTAVASGTLAKNDATRIFVVRIEFVSDSTTNNNAQAQEVAFDLVVTATQQTTAP